MKFFSHSLDGHGGRKVQQVGERTERRQAAGEACDANEPSNSRLLRCVDQVFRPDVVHVIRMSLSLVLFWVRPQVPWLSKPARPAIRKVAKIKIRRSRKGRAR